MTLITSTLGDGVDAADLAWMQVAQALAAQAAAIGEIPVGAIVVKDGQAIGEGFNCPISTNDPTAHAEIIALRQAAQHEQNYRLVDTTLYVTLEPCTMCVGAMVHARIKRLVFGAFEPKAGSVLSRVELLEADYFNHRVEVSSGVSQESCSHQLSDFFKNRREQKRKEKLQNKTANQGNCSDDDSV